jgi:hypothetical protein
MEKLLHFTNNKSCRILPPKYFFMVGFAFFLSFCSFNFVSAQSSKEYNKLLAEMNASSDDEVQLKASRLQELAAKLQPTVYIGDEIKTFGGGAPVCAIVNGSAVSKIHTETELFRSVELLTIKIDQSGLASPIDLSSLSNFPKLKYIRLLCEYSFTASQIQSMVTGSNPAIVVCYLVSLPG